MARMREVKSGGYHVEQEQSLFGPDKDLKTWLVERAKIRNVTLLLAHADDGVIWGRVDASKLVTARDVFGGDLFPELSLGTLQLARLFSAAGEVLLWRVDEGWQARWVTDVKDGNGYYDESQMLWGTQLGAAKSGFTWVHEGRQGLRHAVPIELPAGAFDANGDSRPGRLVVRHYLRVDPCTGLVRVALSRLVDVPKEEGK